MWVGLSGFGPGRVKTPQPFDSRNPDQMQRVGRLTGFGVDNIPSVDNGLQLRFH